MRDEVPAPYLGWRGSLGLVAALAATEAVVLSTRDHEISLVAWWSSLGILVTLLARTPVRRWPVLLVVAAACSVVAGTPFMPVGRVLSIIAAHSVEAVLVAAVLTLGGRVPGRLRNVGDLVRLGYGALAGGALAAVLESPARIGDGGGVVATVLDVFAQHTMSSLLVCSALLAWAGRSAWRGGPLESGAQAVLLAGATALTFVPVHQTPITFLPVPLLVWAALRLDSRLVAVELLAFAVSVTTLTAAARGPFRTGPDDRLFGADLLGPVVIAYVGSIVLLALPLALMTEQRHRLADRLRDEDLRFLRNFTESPLGMVFLHQDGARLHVDDANAAAAAMLGVQGDQLVGRDLQDVVTTVGASAPGLPRLLSGREDSWRAPVTASARPGSHLDATVAYLGTRGSHPQYTMQLLDVTEQHASRRRAESALALTDATLDTTACIIVLVDAAGTVLRVNAATEDLTGFTAGDLVGRPVWETPLAPLTRAETEAMFLWPNRSGWSMVREVRTPTAAGGRLAVVWSNNVVRDEHGLPGHAVLTGVDVTAERGATGLTDHLLEVAIGTAIIGTDTTGRITVFSSGAAHLLGHDGADMIGRPFVTLFDTAELRARTGATGAHDAFTSLVGTVAEGRESPIGEWTWVTADGRSVVVSMTLSMTATDVEELARFICVARDVTEQTEAQRTLETALEKERTAVARLRALDQAKDEIVSTVSHELRTPVTSIMGYTEMLRDGSVVDPLPEQEHMLRTIARNGQRLITICNDLLLLAGFESDVLIGSHAPVDLRECVRAAEESLGGQLAERDLALDVDPGPEPIVVSGARDQLERVVVNLAGNAVKFTEDGGRVRVALERDGEDAVLCVSDTGLGIPEADLEAIFDRFYRTESAQVLAIPGTGLGLPIVASIVEAHAGRIEVDSAPGVGSTFTVRLPLDRSARPREDADGATPRVSPARRG